MRFTMTIKLTLSAATLAELHALPDDAMLSTAEAAAFLHIAANSLNWYRSQRIGPDYVKLGPRAVRYKVGDLRKYARHVSAADARPIAEG
jgi:hypothetical protein